MGVIEPPARRIQGLVGPERPVASTVAGILALRDALRLDYSCVTETPGDRITREALTMLYTRYAFAAFFTGGKDVLEVACGSGSGLGYLASTARRVVGGDVTKALLHRARGHYGGRIPLLRLDAHALPFATASFDVVILYEAIYYLAYPDTYLEECRRILRPEGLLLICSANKEWPDFNPSPYSIRYFSASELRDLLGRHGFQGEVYAGFPAIQRSIRDCLVSQLKRAAIRWHLMPGSMRGKAWLKRVFLGDLVPAPPEVKDGMAGAEPLRPVEEDAPVRGYKVLYAVGRVR